MGKKGVVRDLATHRQVLENFLALAEERGFTLLGLTYSPVKGPEGNIEFLGHLTMVPAGRPGGCGKAGGAGPRSPARLI